MNGLIKSFVPEKKFGFIKGDDGKDYFFHLNEFKNSAHHKNIVDGTVVEFEPSATPKGYRAVNCILPKHEDFSAISSYVKPDEFLTSKTEIIQGWEIVERGAWVISGSSRNSPDEAKENAIFNARRIGANALVEFKYIKSTGEEAGTGLHGIHHFTIHNFYGRIVTVARRSKNGGFSINDLKGINNRALQVTNAAKLIYVKKKKKSVIKTGSIALFSLAGFVISPVFVFVGFGLAIYTLEIWRRKPEKIDWLWQA